MSRLQGIGTAYYGKRDYNPQDESYITTEWFVLFLLPIVPLKSLRIRKMSKEEHFYGVAWSHKLTYQILGEIPKGKNLTQIIKTYLYAYGGLTLFFSSIALVGINDLFIFLPITMIAVFFIWALINSE